MPYDPQTNLYESISKQERNTLETREQKFGWPLGDISIYLNVCLPC